ncbi:MAG: beta-N-acetylhexosaminidase [bacterium]
MRSRFAGRLQSTALALIGAVFVAGCSSTAPSTAPSPATSTPRLVPAPASMSMSGGEPFTVSAATGIVVDGSNAEAARTAELLAMLLRPSTGFPIPVSANAAANSIELRLAPDRASLGNEGYDLTVTPASVLVIAYRPAGLFRATQTIRQLLPAMIESDTKVSNVRWTIPALTISDQPRFAWRGAMLDVARHFFTVDEVKQYIDLLALYKLNVLHLHLSDDQGWRIEIKSRPELTAVGSKTQVGGGPGGFYTQADYGDIIRYAQDRHIMIVPEIDMPGHTNAALSAFPALSCSKRPSILYTGTDVGWSTFCVENEGSYALIDDIVREIVAISPSPYFHMGGDEVQALTPAQYALFVERVQDIVTKHGKQVIGWEEILHSRLMSSTVLQQWRNDSLPTTLHAGGKIIVSGARKMYLDMKYTKETELGLTWAGIIEVRDAYDWDPGVYVKHVNESDILGLEAPMWSETVRNIAAVQYLAVPRLQAIAEVGWTPQSVRNWESFRERIASHAPRWRILGVNYYRSPQIAW